MVLPGFEDVAFEELKSTEAEIANAQETKGGVEFEASLETGFALNSILRAPTKILLRLEEKNCKSFEELRAFLAEIPWENYLTNPKFKMKVSAYRSKLYHKRQIEVSIYRVFLR